MTSFNYRAPGIQKTIENYKCAQIWRYISLGTRLPALKHNLLCCAPITYACRHQGHQFR